MEIQLPESERRWLRAALILGTLVLALVLMAQVAAILAFFSDILLVLLLAWLFAFMISPLVALILRAMPGVPRVAVVGAIYIALALGVVWLTLTVAGSLADSLTNVVAFVTGDPVAVHARLAELFAPLQGTLDSLGFRVDLAQSAQGLLNGLAGISGELAKPLADLALFSLGLLANLLIVVFLSLFIVLDKDRIVAYLNRLVPPQYSDEARLFETSVASSFGGFIRGQAIQGLVMAAIATIAHLVIGVDFLPASAALSGFLQAIPFFGPALSWAPPVVVAVLTKPEAVLPMLVVMLIGWFVVNNLLLPRLMASAVGIHPVAVLVSVLVGLKIAGIAGAIFALPFAAVLAAFFHHFLNRNASGERDVTSRAARLVEEREGRRVRVPKPPASPESVPLPAPAPMATTAKSAAADKPIP
jgi:predicted PurR-regulated permease PerM